MSYSKTIKAKEANGNAKCIARSCCLHPKIDKASRDFLKENPELTFSKLVECALREKLTAAGFYKQWITEDKMG